MLSAFNNFVLNIQITRDLLALYKNLSAATGSVLDLSDILRACIVLGVSALDHFIHGVTRVGMVEIYERKRPSTDAFHRFSVSMSNVLAGISTPGSTGWLEDEIRFQHGWVSFQQADRIADAVRLVSAKKLWEEVGRLVGSDARSAKTQLNLIIDRRNKIAHEADMDPGSPGSRWPIDEVLVQETLDTLELIVKAIFDVLTAP